MLNRPMDDKSQARWASVSSAYQHENQNVSIILAALRLSSLIRNKLISCPTFDDLIVVA